MTNTYKTKVEFTDGTEVEIFRDEQYNVCCEGMMIYWENALIQTPRGPERIDYYSVPIHNIRCISEVCLDG